MYLTFEGKYKEFTVIRINFNIAKNDDKEYPYNEDNFYLEPNNTKYDGIV